MRPRARRFGPSSASVAYTLRATLGGTAGIVVPLVVAWLLARFAFSIDLPDLPLPDLPDLPSIPWPDIPWPDISLPDISLPGWSLPGWVQDLSPFHHLALVPAEDFRWAPFLTLSLVAAALPAVGLALFTRRDVEVR